MSLALTKLWDPEDLTHDLADEVEIVQRLFQTETAQADLRLWEYSMALRAVNQHHRSNDPQLIYDVGGAGSPFPKTLQSLNWEVEVIDPAIDHRPLGQRIQQHPRLADAVLCLSVLEHIPQEELDQFLYHLSCLVAPGGLLFLTMDYWEGEGEDLAHFHWMRRRIFNRTTWKMLWTHFLSREFTLYLPIEYPVTFHPFSNWGYSVASLALEKRR